jgi:molecular chaperone GrpE|tara:strand:- start:5529 stop:6089 length:561 start_codon:yes stop_codon:yes gene_type:complete
MAEESQDGEAWGSRQKETEVEDIEALKEALAEEKTKAESYLVNWQRAQADFINYKRRTEQDKKETGKFANSVLILSLLPVLDDLERALDSVPPRLRKLAWVDGIRLIGRKFRESLKAQGLTPIAAEGEPFDPNLHEAAMRSKGREGIVVRELQRGYKLHDRVLRVTVVAVGSGEGAAINQDEGTEG